MFTLPDLPFSFDALEPSIDAQTMEIHHDKHHGTYVKNLNDLLASNEELLNMDINDLVKNLDKVSEDIRTKVRNNAGGHSNHSFFWTILAKDGGSPEGKLLEQINQDFESLDNFKEKFTTAALGVFGSGWAWVVYKDGKLEIITTPNQDSPLMDGKGTPILGLDVWEHAYYLKYQNKRADYITAFWNVINFQQVAEYLYSAQG